jgi:hypothetical protein
MNRRSRGWRLRTLLVAVAVLALMLGWVRFELTKPRPMEIEEYGAVPPIVTWSDGNTNNCGRNSHPIEFLEYRMAQVVKWSDGSTTYYLGLGR